MNKRLFAIILAALTLNGTVYGAVMADTADEPEEPATVTVSSVESGNVEEVMSEELIIPSGDYSSEVNGSGEWAITEAKKFVGSTDDYKNVDVTSYTSYGMTVWNISWYGSEERGDMRVSLGSDGVVYSYDVDYELSYDKISEPEISQTEAKKLAYDFAMKFRPDDTISLEHSKVSYNKYGRFSVEFYRFANGYRIGDEKINVTLDKSGKAVGYSNDTLTKLELDSNAESKPKAEIIKALNAALPMTLTYQKYYPDGYGKTPAIRLIYTTNDNYNGTAVKASDGKAYAVEYDGDYSGYNMTTAQGGVLAEEAAVADNTADLTEAEKHTVEMLDSFIKSEEAVKIVTSDKRLGYVGELKFKSGRLDYSESEFTGKKTYFWRLTFTLDDKTSSASASVNAETGELMAYNPGIYEDIKVSELKNDGVKCRDTADKFCESALGELFSEYVYNGEDYSAVPLGNADDYTGRYFNYSYVREVNGVKYYDDNIKVTVDPQTLGVTGFNYSYSDAVFPSAAKAISEEKAAERYWAKLPLTPYYAEVKADDGKTLTIQRGNMTDKTATATLVYMAPAYVYIDALTGSLTNYRGDAYVYSEPEYYAPTEFSDVSSSKYEADINRLANLGVIEFAVKYRPDDAVSSETFNQMISWFSRRYYSDASNAKKTSLTRGDALVALIDSLGYSEVAALTDIFKTDESVTGMGDDQLGYAMIAKGLGLLDGFGEKFNAAKKLTKGEAAALICNYVDYLLK